MSAGRNKNARTGMRKRQQKVKRITKAVAAGTRRKKRAAKRAQNRRLRER